MGTDLVNFGEGTLPYNYFYFCFFASIGVLQMVAARYARGNLLWFSPTYSFVLGGLATLGAFVWFFSFKEDIFIPGLAGGELAIEFGGAFLLAVLATRVISAVRARFQPNLRPLPQTYLGKILAVERDQATDL